MTSISIHFTKIHANLFLNIFKKTCVPFSEGMAAEIQEISGFWRSQVGRSRGRTPKRTFNLGSTLTWSLWTRDLAHKR